LNRNRSIEKREGWRGGKGWNEMGRDDVEGSEGKDPVGESLQYISEIQKPRGEVEDDVKHCRWQRREIQVEMSKWEGEHSTKRSNGTVRLGRLDIYLPVYVLFRVCRSVSPI
jgi:hypothetical protein